MTKNLLVDSKSVESCSFHNPLPFYSHFYVKYYIVLYILWLYLYLFKPEVFAHSELALLSLGIIFTSQMLCYLSQYWSVSLKTFMSYSTVKSPLRASFVKLVPIKNHGKGELVPLHNSNDRLWFEFQRKKFFYSKEEGKFQKVKLPINHSFEVYNQWKGYESDSLAEATEVHGLNMVEIPIPTFKELFQEHAVAPFFVFQIFCVGLWCLDEYWYYSVFTLFMLVVFESTVVFQRLKTLQEFRSMTNSPVELFVYRDKTWSKITSDKLLPMDLCSIRKEHDTVPCDLLLIEGDCIVQEAILSGESTPIIKENIRSRTERESLDFSDMNDKKHILFGGTKIIQCRKDEEDEVVAHSPRRLSVTADFSDLKTPDGGCLTLVLRTGFRTSQGKLIRTIIFASERVTANNFESFMFILFLLMFALAAAYYMWTEGMKNEKKTKSKLLLECILIITTVVPPELPMELSLAVNNSLMSLSKLFIFCTEPFRIPFAGKVDVCCFDKTGTLTSNDLILNGVAGMSNLDPYSLTAAENSPFNSKMVMLTCHSLANVRGDIIGDPMERIPIDSLKYTITKHQSVVPTEGGKEIKILKRFPFNSALKRMSTIARTESSTFMTIKGAPEVVAEMLVHVPMWYRKVYETYSRQGSRVLALGYKALKNEIVIPENRDEIEDGFEFCGFLVFESPLKPDSVEAVNMLVDSSHQVVMITGDNPLTACHVAKEVGIFKGEKIAILDDESGRTWKSIDDTEVDVRGNEYGLCVTGKALSKMNIRYLPFVGVFARVSPTQKEWIINQLKELGLITLMCGDGTNDVGALKQSHVGIALLDGKLEDFEKINRINKARMWKKRQDDMKKMSENMEIYAKKWGADEEKLRKIREERAKQERQMEVAMKKNPNNKMHSLMEDLEEEMPVIKLGDASIAAPFTSKLSSVLSVCNIIRQGRCTLVTTLQMYKILALNSLISAYSLSVLYLDGIKYGDFQATLSGMLIACCFMFLSYAKPVEKLSKERPQPNIFNAYVILSVLVQFAIHIVCLILVVSDAKSFIDDTGASVDLEKTFEPSLLNSAVYLLSLSMQVSTFAVNYQGRPFRESLSENRNLRNALFMVGSVAFVAAMEVSTEFNQFFEIVPFPEGFRDRLVFTMFVDFVGCVLVEEVIKFFFSAQSVHPIYKSKTLK